MNTPSIRLSLRVSPGAKRSVIAGRYGDGWKVRVNAAAEKGKANEELIRLLRDALDVGRRDLTIVHGQSSRDKLVEVTGINAGEAELRLAAAAEKQS